MIWDAIEAPRRLELLFQIIFLTRQRVHRNGAHNAAFAVDDAGMGELLNWVISVTSQVDTKASADAFGNAECPENTFLACQRFYETIADFNTYFFLAKHIWPPHNTIYLMEEHMLCKYWINVQVARVLSKINIGMRHVCTH